MGNAGKYAVPVLGAVLVLSLTACGGGDDKKSAGSAKPSGSASAAAKSADRLDVRAVLKSASKKTSEATAFKIVQTTKNNEGDKRVEESWRRKPAPFTTVKSISNAPGKPGKESYSIVTGGFVYTKTDQVPASGKSWFKIETKAGTDPQRTEGLASDRLAVLLASATGRVGEETVNGRLADRYQATVTMADLAHYDRPDLSKEVRDGYLADAKEAGQASVVLDMWIGKDDLPLKSQQRGKGKHGDEDVTEVYSDYGVAPKEQAPPASDVLTWDEYMDALMKG
ncbi:hypothetical protein ACWCWQ_07855 [Streptomyces sp. NPDC001571]|uniref:hypothetical protein n=1 Tax=unclassified Streptomyces TaxID=2593676 RepID=UPI000C27E021|nr:hypothetical protein [Streptomyces sp. CB01201]